MPYINNGVYSTFGRGYTNSALKREGSCFTLNNQPIRIASGALHYFRIHPDQWPDRLAKLRAAGLNCVET